MKKKLLILSLVILLCFTTGFSNAQDDKAIITFQDGTQISVSNLRIEYYGPEQLGNWVIGVDGKVNVNVDGKIVGEKFFPTRSETRIHYCYELNRVVIEKTIELMEIETIEINLEENKYAIGEVKINLWDGSKVIFLNRSTSGNRQIREISSTGEEKVYTSKGLFQGRAGKGEYWYVDFIEADATTEGQSGYFKGAFRQIKTIKFVK